MKVLITKRQSSLMGENKFVIAIWAGVSSFPARQLNACYAGYVGPGVWKLNVSLLQVQEVREQIASFWEHWKDRKSDFGNVAEWWDSGKLRVKSLFLKYSHKESRKRKQERATVLNRYRRIVCKTKGG